MAAPTLSSASSVLSQPKAPDFVALQERLTALERESGAEALAVAVYDAGTGRAFHYHADQWFHAASTIKVAVLLGVYAAIHRGLVLPHSRVHVRNRFVSAADGQFFRVAVDRDADADVYGAIGKIMRVQELSRHMITRSSNLATNILFDLVGLDAILDTLAELGVTGIDVRRGVEDERAFALGINNRVTADGLVALLRTIAEERAFSPELSRQMLEILHGQAFNKGIPARLPRAVRVAHKTGDISTVAHDAGIVYPPGRSPYVIAVLTQWAADAAERSSTIAEASRVVYETLVEENSRG